MGSYTNTASSPITSKSPSQPITARTEPAMRRCVDQLLGRLADSADLPAEQVRQIARRAILEYWEAADEAGDNPTHDPRQIDRCVETVVAEIQEVRRAHGHASPWGETPVPPQMFG